MTTKIQDLHDIVHGIYQTRAAKVPYHGWHHVKFVVDRVSEYRVELQADEALTTAAALVHDFNYLVAGNSFEAAGQGMRREVLLQAGFDKAFADTVERIVAEARTSHRHANISVEAKALSDGDTAYKVLPTTPLMTLDYLAETGTSLRALASKIVCEQTPLLREGVYFYTTKANQIYAAWAKENLDLWTRVLNSLDDGHVSSVLMERSRILPGAGRQTP